MKLLVTLVLLDFSESFSSKSMDDKLETTQGTYGASFNAT